MTATKLFRYLYHHACTAILPSLAAARLPTGAPRWMREQTHGCWCSAWRINADGSLAVWRAGAWQAPSRGEVKSKATVREAAPLGAVEALTRPTRAKPTAP